MVEIQQPELRAYDDKREDGGNVRPADDRHLTTSQKRKRDSYVTKVEEAKADAEATREAVADPLADVLRDAVQRGLSDGRPEATEVTSGRGGQDG